MARERNLSWRTKGRGALRRRASALSDRREDIRFRTPERAEGFQWLFTISVAIASERAEGFQWLFTISVAIASERAEGFQCPF